MYPSVNQSISLSLSSFSHLFSSLSKIMQCALLISFSLNSRCAFAKLKKRADDIPKVMIRCAEGTLLVDPYTLSERGVGWGET